MTVLATVAFVAVVLAVSTTVFAQVPQGRTVVVDAKASGPRVGLTNLDVNLDLFTLRPAKAASSASTRPGVRARSKKRIFAGAVVGSVGGFFGGGFLGAHIEGDRCNCDDPGVRGFLIGAPIGAVAGGIAGAKFLF